MSKPEQPRRGGAATGELLSRPGHGHRSPDPVLASPDQDDRWAADIADPHPSWLKTWRRLRAELTGTTLPETSREPVRALQDKIANTPANTLAGLQAQAELISELAWNDVVAATARQLISGLKRLQQQTDVR